MGDQLEMPKELAGTIFEILYNKAALAAMSPEQRTIYISKTMSRNDQLNSRAEMIEDALQEGYAKGLDEGLAEGRADAARKMIESGMLQKEQVAKILKMTATELEALLTF